MRNFKSPQKGRKALSLVEMTIVILTILILIGIAVPSTRWVNGWQLGKTASEDLRAIYAAQRMYISDNPLAPLAGINAAAVQPYLPPTYAGVMPTIKPISGAALTINVSVTPPIVDQGGIPYDPSAPAGAAASHPARSDGLWDVGQ
jgi:type II secretory pathway pseudopilin PulG